MHSAIQRLVGAFSPDIAYFGRDTAPIGPLLQLLPEQAWSLRERGIWTMRDLWLRLGHDRAAEISRIATDTGIPEAYLALLVAVQSRRRTPVVLPWIVRSGRWLHFLLPASISRLGGPDRTGRWTWIEEPEVAALQSKNIQSVVELWRRIGTNFSTGLQNAVDDQFLNADRLGNLLVAQGVREARWAGRSPLARLIWNFGVAVLLPLSVLLIWLAARQTLPSPYPGTFATSQAVVQVSGGIQPLHVIAPDDVAVRASSPRSGAFGTKDAVVGRIARAQILENEVITARALFPLCPSEGSITESSEPQTPIPNRTPRLSVLSLSVKKAIVEAVAPGDCATLMIAPHDPAIAAKTPDIGLLFGVTVLAIDRGTEPATLVIALSAQYEPILARALGSSDIYVLPPA